MLVPFIAGFASGSGQRVGGGGQRFVGRDRMTGLSAREHACMALITAFQLIEERAPSLREIAKGLGLKEDTQAARIVQSLTRRGLVGRTRADGLQISQVQSFQEASTQP